VGTWWGAIQARLGQSIQAVKNTRSWQIPTAPGERSTLSGQYSALHPRLSYQGNFKEGGGIRESSMRLFWRLMAEVYPGLFNGSEKLNAIELTKRMAWNIGGVAESLGVNTKTETDEVDYESLIRFPNLSAIASARFIYDNPEKTKEYWEELRKLVKKDLSGKDRLFFSRTRLRPNHILKTDQQINPNSLDDKNYNGVMFSSKWLADDLGCDRNETQILRMLVDKAHKQAGFGDASPADWWVIVLGDGDSMGKYVSGKKLKPYQDYLNEDAIDDTIKNNSKFSEFQEKTKKRMGPATHIGLNRALLDFSNRLVPYLTQQRFCGKVVYSGGDDVMAVLPLSDLPEYLLSVRSAWSGTDDPFGEFEGRDSGYWHPVKDLEGLQKRPYFTMGKDATMSLGIVIAHKSVPLPTVLENLWVAEKERAKKIVGKDGLCFRVIYGGGNVLESLMKGSLLPKWWEWIKSYQDYLDLSPLLYRLAEELPLHACVTKGDRLFSEATKVIIKKRDEKIPDEVQKSLLNWLDAWEDWVNNPNLSPTQADDQSINQDNDNPIDNDRKDSLGTTEKDLANLLRFSAFWLDKMQQHQQWTQGD
jgi:CRISPR-associated protein Cmr2